MALLCNFNHNFNHNFANNDDQDEHQGKKIVLVIEDNFDMRQYVESLLIEQYQVLTAENGQLGLEKALSFIPDLIISDVMMPERDGFELTKALKLDQLSSHIPIILLTAISDRKSRLRAWHEKADEYLVKPFDSEELLLRVNNLLSIRDLLKQSFYDKTWKALRSAGIQDELESDLFPCLVDIKFKGVRVDVEKAHILKKNVRSFILETKFLKKSDDPIQYLNKLVHQIL